MSVLIDTSVWSLALRRTRAPSPHADNIAGLLRSGNALLLGIIRQELLSGVPDAKRFERLRDELRNLPDHPVISLHHETAADFFNRCRSRGVQGTLVDFLLCAVAAIDNVEIYTTDQDFQHFAKHLPIKLFQL
jgi:predicted nucleic acid-binding protein